MAGRCVERIYHPECGDHLVQVFENEDGSYSGYCYPLQRYVKDPYSEKPKGYKPKFKKKDPAEFQKNLEEVLECPVIPLPERGLNLDTNAFYGVHTGLSEADGVTPKSRYYIYKKDGTPVAIKVRVLESKQMFSIGDMSEADLFGWEEAVEAGGKRLFITEGEEDALALYQICKTANKGTKYADLNPSIVSLKNGAASAAKSLLKELPKIRNNFKEIVLCFDNDEVGRQAAEDVVKVIPDALVATLPGKDANDCLLAGKIKQAYASIQFRATKPKNTRLVSAASVVEDARKEVPWGFSYPYEGLTELTRGRRFGETYYFGAGVKMGKSELLNDLVAWDIKVHGWKVFVIKPEESNRRTLQGIIGKLVNGIFHDPAVPFDYDLFDKGVLELGDNLIMLNLYQELTWEGLKADIRAAVMEGCRSVYIDPITVLTNGINAADANTLLQKMAQELAQMAMDLQIVVHIFCHLKAPEVGPPHERGGEVQSFQFAGSRAMMRSCHSMIGMEGNKDPDLSKEERNIRTLVLLEDRMTGNSGKIPLYWNDKTGAFTEIKK